MTKRAMVLAGAAALIAAGIMVSGLAAAGTRRSQKKSSARVPVTAGKDIPQLFPAEEPIPEPKPMVVAPHKKAAPEVLALHQAIAKQMTAARLEAPAHRLQQFRWLNDPQFRFQGWHATIINAQEVPNGHLVTVTVIPLITTLGASTTVVSAVDEQYMVSATGEVAFVQPLHGINDAPASFITD